MFYVYIMASGRNGTLYIGQTDNLNRRVFEHQSGAVPGFTADYSVKTLVWFEAHDSRESALITERRMKRWNRDWKQALIEMDNPNWEDLALRLEPKGPHGHLPREGGDPDKGPLSDGVPKV